MPAPLTDAQITVLAPFADTIVAAATAAAVDPATYSAEYGAGGCALVNLRTIQAKAASIRATAKASMATAEAVAQGLDAQANALQVLINSAAAAG